MKYAYCFGKSVLLLRSICAKFQLTAANCGHSPNSFYVSFLFCYLEFQYQCGVTCAIWNFNTSIIVIFICFILLFFRGIFFYATYFGSCTLSFHSGHIVAHHKTFLQCIKHLNSKIRTVKSQQILMLGLYYLYSSGIQIKRAQRGTW